jgi:hypothetical protein
MKSIANILLLLTATGIPWTADALKLNNVSHTPRYVSAGHKQPVTIRFNLDEPAVIQLKIYDRNDYLINSVSSGGVVNAGDGVITWSLNDKAGNRVAPEAYHYVIEASAGSQTVTHDMTDATGNQPIYVANQWDKKSGVINYILPKNARLNMRAGIAEGGPLLRTLLDWVPRKFGKNTEQWNGMDESNVIDISKIEKAEIYINAYTFSSNTIIIGGRADEHAINNKPALSVVEKRKSSTHHNRTVEMARLAVLPDYTVNIILKGNSIDETAAIPIITGIVSVKLDIDTSNAERMSSDRFEPILFIDNTYYSEVESGYLAMTWNLDTAQMTDGEHMITINIRGYNGQYATASKRIRVENK